MAKVLYGSFKEALECQDKSGMNILHIAVQHHSLDFVKGKRKLSKL